jgi:uncharacterized membrane protein
VSRSRTSRILRRFAWYRRSRLWVVPTMGVLAAILLATLTLTLDDRLISEGAPFPVFSGEADTARSMMSLIATSIATLTALVLTIVSVVLQLATQSLSPRAVRTFLQDPKSHLTLGLFVLTFVYVLVVLQQLGRIRDVEQDLVVSISVTTAFVLAVASIQMFIVYADHIIHQARVTSVIERVGDDTLAMIVDQYPRSNAANEITGELPDRVPDLVVRAPRKGHILEIDVAALLDAVAEREVVVAMIPAIGDFIPSDGRLFELYGDADVDPARLASTVDIDAERSITQDVPFGFRLLVDIAERALSSGVNDPTTATQALDRLHDLLRQLGTRPFPTGWHADEHGEPRLFVPQPTWELFVALAFEEIRHYGRDSLQVARRSRAALLDLVDELPDHRHAALHRQLRLLDDMVEAGFTSDLERQAARFPDAQGIGSGQGFDATDDAWDASPP